LRRLNQVSKQLWRAVRLCHATGNAGRQGYLPACRRTTGKIIFKPWIG